MSTPPSFRFPAVFAVLLLTSSWSFAASVTVTNTADAGAGSLRVAINTAHAGDKIVFKIPKTDPGYNPATKNFVITLAGATEQNKTLVINKSLTIDGGAQRIVVRRAPDAPPNFGIFKITKGTVVISRIWVSNGYIAQTSSAGGGILNFGELTVRDCMFTGNAATDGPGAIFNYSSLMVINCTFSGNSGFYGGAIGHPLSTSDCNTTVIGSTFNGNTGYQGGAIWLNTGSLTVKSSTIYGNTSTNPGFTGGGGIKCGSAALVQNTIIAGNHAQGSGGGPDLDGQFTSAGYNIIGNTAESSGFPGAGDQTGVTAAQLNLGPLSDYGGPRPTMLPLPGSVAIDRGKRSTLGNGDPLQADQRGFARTVNRSESNAGGSDATDVGAVEVGRPQPGPVFTVTTTATHGSECTVDDCSLDEAIGVANAVADANTINFAPGVTGTIAIPNSSGLSVTTPMTIRGPGARLLSVSGMDSGRVFNVAGANVQISGLDILNGSVNGANGGGIQNSGGLTLTDCSLRGNFAAGTGNAGNGGGIFNAAGAVLKLIRCTFNFNIAQQFGGLIYSDGTIVATNCTFVNGRALNGGGILSSVAGGASKVALRNCTITGCTSTATDTSAGAGGGGVYAQGGQQQYHLWNTIIAGNSSQANPSTNPDVRGNYTTEGHNLIGNVGFATGFSNNVNGDKVGTPGAPINPQLGAVRPNGGPTDTIELGSNSPARNAGNDATAPATDQRRFRRIGVSDIGAFEFGSSPSAIAEPAASDFETYDAEANWHGQ